MLEFLGWLVLQGVCLYYLVNFVLCTVLMGLFHGFSFRNSDDMLMVLIIIALGALNVWAWGFKPFTIVFVGA